MKPMNGLVDGSTESNLLNNPPFPKGLVLKRLVNDGDIRIDFYCISTGDGLNLCPSKDANAGKGESEEVKVLVLQDAVGGRSEGFS